MQKPIAGRSGAIGEDVPEVGAARGAHRFGAHHPVGAILLERHLGGIHRLGEARPARARVVLGLRREQRLVARRCSGTCRDP